MKMISRVIVLAALVALGVWLWTIFFPSPEKIIRKQLTKLAQDVSFSQNENDLVKVAGAQNVADFFTENVEVNITVQGRGQETLTGRDQIRTVALESRQEATSLDVKFPDVNVTVAPDRNSAVADVTVDATVSGERDAIIQELDITFQKIDGHWLISKVETVQGVSKPN
ncbi:MAG TPA: nuclear transport factor 2 family protein [Candidatus Sulfotelmatobacter sp.]|nr:nuclear transport factor 2 family protein [Candidatus Sulfotelmatobacter sp.]